MKNFIALYKNGKYKVMESESDVYKKKDKIEFLLIPTDTRLKGITYTLIEGCNIVPIEEEIVTVSGMLRFEMDRFVEEPFHYKFKVNNLITAYNIYPFYKLFSQIAIFTSNHPGCNKILPYATIEEYPGSTRYPYRLDRDKYEEGYHDALIRIVFKDGTWIRLDSFDEVPEDFSAIFIYSIYAHDGYLFTKDIYDNLIGGDLFLEVSVMHDRDYPTEGETLLEIELKDPIRDKFNQGHMNYILDMIELLLITPQIIMFFVEILHEELYMLLTWNGYTINQFIKPGELHDSYSFYNLLFNN